MWLRFYDGHSHYRYKNCHIALGFSYFVSLLLKIFSIGLSLTPNSSADRERCIYLTTHVSKKLRSSPSRVLGSKGSLNDPAPSVSLGQGGEPHKRTTEISLKEEEKKG